MKESSVNKWFERINKKDQTRIFDYLDKIKHIKNDRLKIETMMNKTKYLESFCAECVEEWNREQDNRSIKEIDDKNGNPNMEYQEELF